MKEQQMGMISKHRQSRWEQGLPFFAAAQRFAPSLLSLTRIPFLSVPARAMAGSRRRTFLLQAQRKVQDRTEEGRQLRDHSTSPPTLLSARLAPDGAEGQAGAAKVALSDHPQTANQPSPCPDGSTGHFGPFSVTLGGDPQVCAVRPPHPPSPRRISTQSLFFAIHINPPTAVPPFP